MRYKKQISIFIVAILLMASLSGCKSKSVSGEVEGVKENTSPKNEEIVMGRYMEKEFAFPEGVNKTNVISLIKDEQGNLEIYTKEEESYYCYLQKEDDSFEKTQQPWINVEDPQQGERDGTEVFYGEDGELYAYYRAYGEGTAYSNIIKASKDKQSGELLDLAYLKKILNETDEYKFYPTINNAKVLENGNIVIGDSYLNGIYILDAKTGEEISNLNGYYDENANNNEIPFGVKDNFIIMVNQTGDKIIAYNTQLEKVEREISIDRYTGDTIYEIGDDGTIYMANKYGITKVSPEGTLWENMVDGELSSLNMPSIYLNNLIESKGSEGKSNFYGLVFDSSANGLKILEYQYDSTVSSIPSKELSVYSLKENKTLRQAIATYQRENTDVKITYNIAMAEDASTTVEDYVKVLNTQLLAGKGADVLILDGLPKDSYIEKGVLEDMSELVEGNKELQENIISSYIQGEKTYSIPTRFQFPYAFGTKEAVDAVNSITLLNEFTKQSQTAPIVLSLPAQALTRIYATYYYNDIVSKEGKIKEESLQALLEVVKSIHDGIEDDMTMGQGKDLSDTKEVAGVVSNASVISLVSKSGQLGMGQLSNITDMMLPFSIIDKNEYSYSSMNQSYIPSGVVGINSASQNKDLAKDFIGTMLSKEIQATNLYDGLPVNQQALQAWFEEQNDNLMIGFSSADGQEVTAVWPEKEDRDNAYKMVQKLSTPIETNEILIEKIAQIAEKYYAGQSSEEQTIQEIESGISTYLAE